MFCSLKYFGPDNVFNKTQTLANILLQLLHMKPCLYCVFISALR